jgi:hypothetical protein
MDVLSLLQAGFNGAKRDQENHRQSKRKKKHKVQKDKSKQEQAVLQEFCTVHLYITAGFVAVASCRSFSSNSSS